MVLDALERAAVVARRRQLPAGAHIEPVVGAFEDRLPTPALRLGPWI